MASDLGQEPLMQLNWSTLHQREGALRRGPRVRTLASHAACQREPLVATLDARRGPFNVDGIRV
jgi:hypothetical protein